MSNSADQPSSPLPRLFGLKPPALLTLKAVLVAGLTLVLLIPLYMVWDAIAERQNRYNEAVRPQKGIYNWDPGAFFGMYRPDSFFLASGS